jgi:hypothetical protein
MHMLTVLQDGLPTLYMKSLQEQIHKETIRPTDDQSWARMGLYKTTINWKTCTQDDEPL